MIVSPCLLTTSNMASKISVFSLSSMNLNSTLVSIAFESASVVFASFGMTCKRNGEAGG